MLFTILLFLLFSGAIIASAWSADNPESVYEYAGYLALKEGLNVGEFMATLECEASFRNVQSGHPNHNGPNGREDSWGVVQIHLPSHLDITREQALQPFWSLNWMAEQWVKGNKRIWSCWHTAGKNYLVTNS